MYIIVHITEALRQNLAFVGTLDIKETVQLHQTVKFYMIFHGQ